MKKEELEITIDYYVEKLRSIEQEISDLRKEKESIRDELVLHNCPFKVGDYVLVTRERNGIKITDYGIIKLIKYDFEHRKFLYGIYYVYKQTKVLGAGQIYYSKSTIIEKCE